MRSYKSNLYVDTFVTVAFYCMYMCMNFVHTVAFYNCRYRYCYLQFVTIASYCIYMCMKFVHSCVWQLFLKNKRWEMRWGRKRKTVWEHGNVIDSVCCIAAHRVDDQSEQVSCPRRGVHHTTPTDGCIHRLTVGCHDHSVINIDHSCSAPGQRGKARLGEAGDGRGLSAFASAHRGKWGQLTPLENGWKIKKRKHAKKSWAHLQNILRFIVGPEDYRKFIVRSAYNSDLQRAKTSFRDIVS